MRSAWSHIRQLKYAEWPNYTWLRLLFCQTPEQEQQVLQSAKATQFLLHGVVEPARQISKDDESCDSERLEKQMSELGSNEDINEKCQKVDL